jgi:hypothetical protein
MYIAECGIDLLQCAEMTCIRLLATQDAVAAVDPP